MVDVVDELRHGSEYAECKCFRCRAADEIERLRLGLRLAKQDMKEAIKHINSELGE